MAKGREAGLAVQIAVALESLARSAMEGQTEHLAARSTTETIRAHPLEVTIRAPPRRDITESN